MNKFSLKYKKPMIYRQQYLLRDLDSIDSKQEFLQNLRGKEKNIKGI